MAPKQTDIDSVKEESGHPQNVRKEDEFEKLVAPQANPWKYQWLIPEIVFLVYIHLAGLYGIYLAFYAKWASLLFCIVYWIAGGVGITAGAHRLWAHRAYKATMPLQILFMLFFSNWLCLSIFWFAQIHRRHHKFADTDADPHNATRGFFFCHIGWLVTKSHPESVKRRDTVDLSDLKNNAVIMFQKKHATSVTFLMSLVVPMAVLVSGCGESWNIAWHINMFRIAGLINSSASINSVAHSWGTKPYDKNIVATQNSALSAIAFGEGFHNYHHTFPWDYKTAELGNKWLNFTTKFIDFIAKIGWAYDLKTVPPEIIAQRVSRTGDGSNSWGFNTEHSTVEGDIEPARRPAVKRRQTANIIK